MSSKELEKGRYSDMHRSSLLTFLLLPLW
jgi:hypothetical protein